MATATTVVRFSLARGPIPGTDHSRRNGRSQNGIAHLDFPGFSRITQHSSFVFTMMSHLNVTLLSLERSESARKEQTMNTVTSKDSTPIAFDRSGEGAPIILVVGAFNDRATGAPLAATLSAHFTVFNYDRRGRGASGDSTLYAIEREIEDLAALLDEAGGS